MPPSQLKQLKVSLRDSGVLGPQKSKKQRKASNKDAQKKNSRNVALEGIRERFNPFEAKAPGRREKFEIASNRPTKTSIERPGVTRGLGEERRRETLLKEMQTRNKVGGMLDRRFGEDDPNMTPEQKAAERFAQQALRMNKKNTMFNLEEDSEEEMQLTHGGRALALDNKVIKDDFNEDFSASDLADLDVEDNRPRKRARMVDSENQEEMEENGQLRKRSKHEVMQEVIAKSKAYKAARQAAKEDDDELRMALDKGMGDMFASLQGKSLPAKQLPSPPITDSEPTLDPSRAAMLAGKSREDAEKEYEANLRQLKLEARSKPSVRTKSEGEKAAEEKARLEDLERRRLRRMRGENDSSDEDLDDGDIDVDENPDDAEAFGLRQPQPQARYIPQLEVEEEDEFVMDDLVASDSEAEADSTLGDDGDTSDMEELLDDGDDDFINGLVLPPQTTTVSQPTQSAPNPSRDLPFTFPCPQNYQELIDAMRNVNAADLPTVVQRIRALYHKGLAPENETKLGNFAKALIPWLSDIVNGKLQQNPSMQTVEQLIRHLHSMAKAQPITVAVGFREFFRSLLERPAEMLTLGDLIVLIAVSAIYPTSDQWHTVVTPAMSLLGRHLSQTVTASLAELAQGALACSIFLKYQSKSDRVVPEAINFICKGLELVMPPSTYTPPPLTTPKVTERSGLELLSASVITPSRKLNFEDLRQISAAGTLKERLNIVPEAVLLVLLDLTVECMELYSSKTAFAELLAPMRSILVDNYLQARFEPCMHPATRRKITEVSDILEKTVENIVSQRKPLFLHNHRPLAIKSSYPAFTDNYNPERRHQDPDRERAELSKLRAEHKKERKGAMRELRKDANFMAREQLREKKAKDEAYEKKFKKLVAEIQGEEGREAKEYEREKAKRKGRF